MLDENEVRKRIEREGIPDVESFEVTLRPDSTGEDAAYIYVTVPDDFARETDFFDRAEKIDDAIFELFNRDFQGYWPYVRFRSVSEMAALQ